MGPCAPSCLKACVLTSTVLHVGLAAAAERINTASLLACMQGEGAAVPARMPRWSPAELVPLVMLPVLIWLGLDILHITPRASQPRIAANPGITFGRNTSAQEPAPPPPPELLYWQKVGELTSRERSGGHSVLPMHGCCQISHCIWLAVV